MEKWNDYKMKDVLNINKSYYYYLKSYFLSKNFRDYDRSFIKNNDLNIQFNVDVFGGTIGIIFNRFKGNEGRYVNDQIFLTNYIFYPNIIEGLFIRAVHIPYPSWGYGFLEATIKALENFLLDDMYYQKGIYNELLLHSTNRLKRIQKEAKENNFPPTTGKMVEDDIMKMCEIKLEPKILSYELYKKKKSPYKDIHIIKEIIN